MGVASFIANRIAFNRQKSFSRFIIRLSIVATVISVAVMIVTLSFVNGFQETISNKIFSFWGHIRVQFKQPQKSAIAEEIAIEKNDSAVAAIRKFPGVKSIHAFATKYAILKSPEEIDGVLLKGLDPSYDTLHMEDFMQQGRWIDFSDSAYAREIIISSYTASQTQVKVNDSIFVYFAQKGEERPRTRKVLVAGIYKTGIEDYDKIFGITDIRLLQRMNQWNENEIGGYEIFLGDYRQMLPLSIELYEMVEFPAEWDAKNIRDIYPNIFDWLNIMDTNRNVLIGCMIVVAIINLITCLIILVLERVRMIGVLKALGATDWTVQKIFLRQAALITLSGILAGAVIGLGLLYAQEATGFIKLKEEAYYMSTAAVKIIWWQVAAVCAGTLMVCILVLLIPSLIVKRVRPVKAIQFR